MNTSNQPQWRRILQYIRTEQAAVLIGPEACQINGQPLHQALESYLFDIHRDSIAYHYKQDGLFLFEDKTAKNDAAQDVGFFFDEYQPAEELYRQLAELKVHLYISMNPDTWLSDIFYKYSIRHRFNYYRPQITQSNPQ